LFGRRIEALQALPFNQKTPGSCAAGSTSGVKRISRSVNSPNAWLLSSGDTSPARNVDARENAAA